MADNLNIHQIRSLLDSQINRSAEIRPAIPQAAPAQVGETQGPSFSETLTKSIQEINDLQLQADKQMEQLATGQSNNVQETILAVEKADVSFRMMMEVRNKIISAYQEVMRTQV